MKLTTGAGRLKAAMAMFFLAALPWVPLARAQSEIARVLSIETGGSYLGIEMEDVTAENMATHKLASERGVIVRSVEKGSPAETANLQEKDVILEYAGTPVFSSFQFARLVRETPAGRKVDLVVSREGKKLNLAAKIDKREARSPEVRRLIERLPRGEGQQYFYRGRPDGRAFEFRIPEGSGQAFAFPGEGGLIGMASEKPRLGVTLQPLTTQMAEFLGVAGKKGVLVTSIVDSSPAVGKLKAGDVIIGADGRTLENPEELNALLRKKESQAKVELKIVRDKKELSVAVELSKTDGDSRKGGYRL